MSRTDLMCPRQMQDAAARVLGLEAGHLECGETVVEDRGQAHFLPTVSEPDPDRPTPIVLLSVDLQIAADAETQLGEYRSRMHTHCCAQRLKLLQPTGPKKPRNCQQHARSGAQN